MAWYGMVWHGMAWYGMAWHGMVWHGMAWYGSCLWRNTWLRRPIRHIFTEGSRVRSWQHTEEGFCPAHMLCSRCMWCPADIRIATHCDALPRIARIRTTMAHGQEPHVTLLFVASKNSAVWLRDLLNRTAAQPCTGMRGNSSGDSTKHPAMEPVSTTFPIMMG